MKLLALSVATIAAFGLWPSASHAQVAWSTPTPTPVPSAESIVVVGTNLPEAEETGPDPIIAIDREQIDKAGERTAADFLRNLTVSGSNGAPTSNNNTGSTPGASSISLRGFDPGLTLVLIDGRRVANYPIGINGLDPTCNGAPTRNSNGRGATSTASSLAITSKDFTRSSIRRRFPANTGSPAAPSSTCKSPIASPS